MAKKIIRRLADELITLVVGFVFVWMYIIAFVSKTVTRDWSDYIFFVILVASYIIGIAARALYNRIKK